MQRIRAFVVRGRLAVALACTLACTGLVLAAPQDQEPVQESIVEIDRVPSRNSIEWLLNEVAALSDAVAHLRQELAEARLEQSRAEQEAAELRQFIQDRREYGEDFARYVAVKAIAEREARRKETEALREKREMQKAARRARQTAAREQRDQEDAESQRLDRYRNAGFSHIGLDVFTGKMAYSYATIESDSIGIDYDPYVGRYLRPLGRTAELDYRTMTISGSVLNAEPEIRNIGIAIAFFDEDGNQVGGEIIQINNARPDVPYPFTSEITMALNRAFSSSSTYVLYADPLSPAGSN